ncbi:DUF2922 domain-containing protein [Anaerococcus tetradius]|uniref:DUF2922 domain-containing protein n=1 Tax=Anaerococcus tetradius TaxID=33036 RepID=UPI0023F08FDA|nr:DUF2922 domain-containing protein [Anaerococcus tetradius]
MNQVLKLQFADEQGAKRIISIDKPKGNLDENAINKAMDEIIASGSLATKNGKLTKKVKAYLETIDIKEYKINK